MPHPHFYPIVGDPAEMCIDVKMARECSSHGICPPAGLGVLLISTSIPRGWGLRGAEFTCGLSSSGTSGEHLGSHQMGHLPPQVHSPQLAAPPGDVPKGPSCSSACPSQHWWQPALLHTVFPGSFSKFQDRFSLSPSPALVALGHPKQRLCWDLLPAVGAEFSVHAPVTKGGTRGVSKPYFGSNGEEQNGSPKPAGTEPSPRARHWSPDQLSGSLLE